MPAIHIDTDIGGDIADLCALAMVLRWPEADLLAVTTVSDDAGRRTRYARYVLDQAGRSDIPVAAGADVALGRYTPTPGFPDETAYWPEPVPPDPTPRDEALTLLERSIERGAVIAAIGPYTNLALKPGPSSVTRGSSSWVGTSFRRGRDIRSGDQMQTGTFRSMPRRRSACFSPPILCSSADGDGGDGLRRAYSARTQAVESDR